MGRVVPGSLRNPSPQPLARHRLHGIHQARPAQLRGRTGMAERHRRGGSSQQPGTEPADDLEAGRRPMGRDGRRRRRSGQRERRRRPATNLQFSRTDRHRRLGETRPRGARRPHRVAPLSWQRDRLQLPGHHRRCVPTRERHVNVRRGRVRCGSPRSASAPSATPDEVKQSLRATARPAADTDAMAVGTGEVDAYAAATRAPSGGGTRSLPKSDGLGSLANARGTVQVETGGLVPVVLSGLLTAELLLWDPVGFVSGDWTANTWYLRPAYLNPWQKVYWVGSNWGGSNWVVPTGAAPTGAARPGTAGTTTLLPMARPGRAVLGTALRSNAASPGP